MNNSVLKMFTNRISSGGREYVLTPQKVASDAIDIIPKEEFLYEIL